MKLRFKITQIVIELILLFCSVGMWAQTTYYVDVGVSSGGDGTSWNNAYRNLQDALSAVSSGDSIFVARGTYYPVSFSGNRDATPEERDISFVIPNNVKVYGGFPTGGDVFANRDWVVNETNLSGDINRDGYLFNNSYHVVYTRNVSSDTYIDGFTISGGNAYIFDFFDQDMLDLEGGGWFNIADGSGNSSSPTIVNCVITGNSATNSGGGLFNLAINDGLCSPLLVNCELTENSADQFGGGMSNRTENGGISSPILKNFIFTKNSANNGAALYNEGTTNPKLIQCLLYENQVSPNTKGGIITNIGASSPELLNCVLSYNKLSLGTVMINFERSNNSPSPVVANCIFYKNTIDGSSSFNNSPSITTSFSHCILDEDFISVTKGGSILNVGNNKLYTNPQFFDASSGNFHLKPTSPARDMGLNSVISEVFDFEGDDRLVNGTIDIGAYEWSINNDYPYAGVVYVDLSAVGDNNGTTWRDAFTDLQQALRARSNLGDSGNIHSIYVAEGVYFPSPNPANRDSSFRIPDGVKVLGGFPKGGSPLSSRDWNANETILSGDINQDNMPSGNSYHVVYTENVSSATVVDGFTIVDGNANGAFPKDSGGGWYNHSIGNGNVSSPSIMNSKIINNNAENNGAGIYNLGEDGGVSSPLLSNCMVSGNKAVSFGGGIYNLGENGGVSSPRLLNCTISGNLANSGGGIFNEGNTGGSSSPTLTQCVISGNSATNSGGGIFNEGNTGGNSSPTLTNCVISGNSATNSGGAMVSEEASAGESSPELINCIVSHNIGGSSPIFHNVQASILISYSLFDSSFNIINHNESVIDNGNNIFSTDPQFLNPPLPSSAPTIGGDFHLLSNSPAIDMGFNDAIPESIDFEGNPRVYIGTIDMGVYEWRRVFDCDSFSGIVYVDSSANGTNDGTSWNNAYTNLQDALLDRGNCPNTIDSILIAEGTYFPTSNHFNKNMSFWIPNGIVMLGGFPAGGGTMSSRNWTAFKTILSGDIDQDSTLSGNSFHVVRTKNLSLTTIVDGCIITMGNANGNSIHSRGGGWLNEGNGSDNMGELTIQNCEFNFNEADFGGSICNLNMSNLNIINCDFWLNKSHISGGAIVDYSLSNLKITNCNFTSNEAGLDGGAISISGDGGIDITNCLFISNFASSGGAVSIYNGGESVVFTGCKYKVNIATNGGSIDIFASNPLFFNCEFQSNIADEYGGVMNNSGSSPKFTNCVFSSNSAQTGGVLSNFLNLNIESAPKFINCVFYKNTGLGSVMFNTPNTNFIDAPDFTNSIFYENINEEFQSYFGTKFTVSYSMFDKSSLLSTTDFGLIDSGYNVLGVDPLFVDESDNDFRLNPYSLAIDIGLNEVNTSTNDLDGNFRIHNGTIDLGPYEWEALPVPPIGDNKVLYVDLSATGNNNGDSWENAFNDLQKAFTAQRNYSGQVDTIFVAEGTYYPSLSDTNRTASFLIPDGIVIMGGYPAGGGDVFERDPEVNKTILSGDIDRNDDLTGNSYHVIRTKNVGPTTVMDGFIIWGGNASSNLFPDDQGGGWINEGSGSNNRSNPTIRNCKFLENSASFLGGAMYNDGSSGGESSPVYINCIFSGNSSSFFGGAIFNEGSGNGKSSPEFYNSVFSGNFTMNNGGSVYNSGNGGECSPKFLNCVFSGNKADAGGAIFNTGNSGGICAPEITNCILFQNTGGSSTVFHNVNASTSIMNSMFDVDFTEVDHGGTVIDNGNNLFETDPLFVNAPPSTSSPTSVGDFHILSTSPAVDMGTNQVLSQLIDLDGNTRIYNGIIDIGPYESMSVDCSTRGNVLFVDVSAMGLNKGTSWMDAYTDLRHALLVQQACNVQIDSIFVAKGTYYPTNYTTARDISFWIPDGAVVLGGFPSGGGEIGEIDWIVNETILSGDINQDNNLTGNSYHVVQSENVNSSTELNGFTIVGGNANGTQEIDQSGGGIRNVNSEINLLNINVKENYAFLNGGGMYNLNSSIKIGHGVIQDNLAQFDGGGIFDFNSNTEIEYSAIKSNTSNNNGGGIYYSNFSSGSVFHSIISGNSTNHIGGGLATEHYSNPNFNNSLISGNRSENGGGVAHLNNNFGSYINVTISGNYATSNGGGVFNNNLASPRLFNSIIWNNSANGITNSLTASIYNEDINSNPEIRFSLIENSGGSSMWNLSSGIDQGNNKDVDPQFILEFDPLMAPNAGGDFHHLPTSPVIDMGGNSLSTVSIDLDSNVRILNKIINIGVYETEGCSLIANDVMLLECETLNGKGNFDLEDSEAGVNGGMDVSYSFYSDALATTSIMSSYAASDGEMVYVVVKDDNSVCTDTAMITLRVAPSPLADDEILTECETLNGNGKFTLSDAESGVNGGDDISYSYYSDALATTSISSPYSASDGEQVYVVVTDDNTSCTDTAMITLRVAPSPLADDEILTECETFNGNGEFTLSAAESGVNGGDDISYSYYRDALATTSISSPYSASDGEQVYVVVTDDNTSCTDTAMITLRVTPSPLADDEILTECETFNGNGEFTLSAAESGVNGGDDISYSYYSDALATTSISSPYSASDGEQVYVVVTDDNTSCTDTAMITLRVTPSPLADDEILTECETFNGNGEFTLSAAESAVNGGDDISYSYYSDALATTSISSPYTASDGEQVYVVVTDDNTSCTDTAMITLRVTPSPLADDEILTECETFNGNGEFTLSAAESGVNGGDDISYSYYSDALATTSISSPYSASDGGQVYVVVTDDNTSCTDTAMLTLRVTPSPLADDEILTECETFNGNGEFTLSAAESGVNGGDDISYSYYSDALATTSISSPYSASDGGQVYVVVTDDNTSCTDTAMLTLRVTPSPLADDEILTECETFNGNGEFTLSAAESAVNGGDDISYSYYSDALATTSISSPYTASDGEQVYVVVTDDNTSCTDTAMITLRVTPSPLADDEILTECETFNGNGEFTLSAAESGVNGGDDISYSYYSDALATTSISSPYSASDGEQVYVVVTDDNISCTDTAMITLRVTPSPLADDEILTECETLNGNGEFTLSAAESAVNGGDDISYSYYSDALATTSISSPYTASDGEQVYVVVTDDNTSCTDTAMITLRVTPSPLVDDEILTVCETFNGIGEFTLSAAESGVNGGDDISYSYYSDALATTTISSTYTASDGEQVYVVVTDDNTSCTDTAVITLLVMGSPNVICNRDTMVSGCLSQTEIDLAFSDWLAGFSNDCLDCEVSDLSVFEAPGSCGGETIVKYLISDLCGVRKDSCVASFKVIPSIELLTCPLDMDVYSNMDDEAIQNAYENWLNSTGFSSDCGIMVSNNGGDKPNMPENINNGITQVSWTITSSCGQIRNCSAIFTIHSSKGGIQSPTCGNFSPSVNKHGEIIIRGSNLLINAEKSNYPLLVKVYNQWNGVIKVFELADYFESKEWNVCEFLGSELKYSVANDSGYCSEGMISLRSNLPIVLTSSFEQGQDGDDYDLPTARVSRGKIVTYCGYIPNADDHKPTVAVPCNNGRGAGYYGLAAQPDWIMPINCTVNTDTAEVIFRTWEVFNKEGVMTTLTDTIVVMRLPALIPENFVGYKEDTTYCEIDAAEKSGETVKRYAAWKQPMGLHDYELPTGKMGAITYELPAAVIATAYRNADNQDLLEEYLACVILKKNDKDQIEYTIGDIIDGSYIADVLANASSSQLGYGALNIVARLADDWENYLIASIGSGYFPYVFLEKGDRVLSADGYYEEVTDEWFWDGNGNSPYWFAAGWPSVYGSGDCIRYCDIAGDGLEDCVVNVLLPVLEDGVEGAVEICLDDISGAPHCGITVTVDALSWTGSCPQTKGQDVTVKQTCFQRYSNGEPKIGGYDWDGYADAIANDNHVVVNADEYQSYIESDHFGDGKVSIQLSQWLTLQDTIGPVFDFCYPVDGGSTYDECNTCEVGEWNHEGRWIGNLVNMDLKLNMRRYIPSGYVVLTEDEYQTLSDYEQSQFKPYPSEIEEAIRAGGQYSSAKDWEQCHPIIYTTESHDCAADVFVPSVTLKDNCSGLHSVKAMVNGRAVQLERLATTEEGYVTFAHTSNPIRIAFGGHGVQTEVRYEAADSCWNQSEWFKYIEIKDATPPTVVMDDEVLVSLTAKEAWVNAETFDEGSWDNCGIDLMLARRTDWWSDTACVDLCPTGETYTDWADLLEDLGFSDVDGALAGVYQCGEYDYDITALKKFLNSETVENHYYQKLVWLWEDSYECGEFVVHGWVYDMVKYILLNDNCSGPDADHGNRLKIEEFEGFLDAITGKPGYGKEVSYLGGGWSPAIPFKCEDACETPTVELLVMDYWCNWGKGWLDVEVEDKSQAKVHRALADVAISCESYNVNYKSIIEAAAAYGEGGSVNDSTGAFDALNAAFGYYEAAWVNSNGVITDAAGNEITIEDLRFSIENIACAETEEVTKVADTLHDGIIDWINVTERTTDLVAESIDHSLGLLSILCQSRIETQDVWVDLDDCGNGIITRRFDISGGCGPKAPSFTLEQNIYVNSACELGMSMFDTPADTYTQESPVCVTSLEAASTELAPSVTGKVELKADLVGALCNSIAIGVKEEYISEVQITGTDGPQMYKLTRVWNIRDWCSTIERDYEQTIVFVVDANCAANNGDVSLTGQITDQDQEAIAEVEVKAVLNSGSPLTAETTGNGQYGFNLNYGSSVNIVPQKNTGHGQGITTQDVIAIQSHIMQESVLTSDYDKVAADVDGNGLINAFDILETRRMVLTPNRKLANNTSWRFFMSDGSMRESYESTSLRADENIDFVGVKIGDVNRTENVGRSQRSGLTTLNLSVVDQGLISGELYRVDVTSENFDEITGMQYTLAYANNAVEVESIEGGALNFTEDNYVKYRPGFITASWSEGKAISASENEVLFTLVVRAKADVSLRDVLSVSDRVIMAEAYTGSEELKNIQWQYNSSNAIFALYQNTPNPYAGQTAIGFTLPEASEATLTMYDVTGKVLKVIEGRYGKGYNKVWVNSEDFGMSGVLYYQLDTEKYTATKKMVVIK